MKRQIVIELAKMNGEAEGHLRKIATMAASVADEIKAGTIGDDNAYLEKLAGIASVLEAAAASGVSATSGSSAQDEQAKTEEADKACGDKDKKKGYKMSKDGVACMNKATDATMRFKALVESGAEVTKEQNDAALAVYKALVLLMDAVKGCDEAKEAEAVKAVDESLPGFESVIKAPEKTEKSASKVEWPTSL